MIAYTGIETVSNLAEEARDPQRSIPSSIKLVAVAVFAIYFTLPLVALSALPVSKVDGKYQTLLGLPPEKHGFANDPVLGLVEHLGIHGSLLSVLKIYVGLLAATILFIATNAGVIGASRITYAMSTYRQLPEIFRRLHPRFKTPWLALSVFAGLVSIAVIIPGKTNFLGTMYSFGAMLSFTIAHASIVALRYRRRNDELVYRARPNLRLRGVDWPLFAILGGLGTGVAWLVVVVQNPPARWAGLGWLAVGFAVYGVYRGRYAHISLRETTRAPALVLGPSLTVEYRTVIVPVLRTAESEEALVAAARLAAERRATIVIMTVIEIPLELPPDTRMEEAEREANQALDDAQALVESYGVRAITRLVRARRAGPAVVREAADRNAELIVLGAPRRGRRGGPIFGKTVDYVLKNAPCRVLLAAGRKAA
jgi:APA family basic amino acid/polyamine antiporter